MGMRVLVGLILLSGCAAEAPPRPVAVEHIPDCVNNPFNYDFYSHADQVRLTYCYAVLQMIAKGKSNAK
jgi:hypothetical protein